MRVSPSAAPPQMPVARGEPDEAATPSEPGSDNEASPAQTSRGQDTAAANAPASTTSTSACQNPDWVPQWAPNVIRDGKYAVEAYARYGGGAEVSIDKCELQSVKVEAGVAYQAGMGKSGYVAVPVKGAAAAQKYELMPSIESAAAQAGEARLGLSGGISLGMPALSLDLISVSVGVGRKADGSFAPYGSVNWPSVAVQPAAMLSPEGWRPEAGAKGGVEFSYQFK